MEIKDIRCKEPIKFIDVDIERKDETFYQLHINFFIKHLRTDRLVFFTSEDVKYLNNFEFLRTMEINEVDRVDLIRDEDFNNVFFLRQNMRYFNNLDVCLILNGVVDVMVMRKEDIENFAFHIEYGKLVIK